MLRKRLRMDTQERAPKHHIVYVSRFTERRQNVKKNNSHQIDGEL